MSYKDKLTEKLDKMMKEDGLKGFGVTLAPNADITDPEKIYKEISEAIDRANEYNRLPTEVKMLKDIKQLYVDMTYMMNCLSYNRIVGIPLEEAEERIRAAWGVLDMAICHAGNWISYEERKNLDIEVEKQHNIQHTEQFYRKKRF